MEKVYDVWGFDEFGKIEYYEGFETKEVADGLARILRNLDLNKVHVTMRLVEPDGMPESPDGMGETPDGMDADLYAEFRREVEATDRPDALDRQDDMRRF